MDHEAIKKLLDDCSMKRARTIVIVDYGNVNKWRESLKWQVGIRELANLIKHFSFGKEFLRRFYYGSDYGKSEKSQRLDYWSGQVLDTARRNRFEIITKRVKYIHNDDSIHGFDKKCDLDVEMAIDLVKEKDNYDTIILFSGDGDLVCAVKYLKEMFGKECYVFGARGHVGREVYDAKNEGIVTDILYAEDFEYRLNNNRRN